jgi:hypothetical protein
MTIGSPEMAERLFQTMWRGWVRDCPCYGLTDRSADRLG